VLLEFTKIRKEEYPKRGTKMKITLDSEEFDNILETIVKLSSLIDVLQYSQIRDDVAQIDYYSLLGIAKEICDGIYDSMKYQPLTYETEE